MQSSSTKALRVIQILLCSLALACVSTTAFAQSESLPDNWAVYSCNPIGGRLLEIERFGNESDRNAEIAVLELTDTVGRLRVLHHISTRSPFGPLTTANDRSGRFLVTMDEWYGVVASERDLVIYDLVRDEYSEYSIRDFLSDESVARLEPSNISQGLRWCGRLGGAFDYDRMIYYPTTPRDCRELDLPFVVVDLLTREIREEPIPDIDFEVSNGAEEPFFRNAIWRCSMGSEPLPPDSEPLLLPEFLRVEFGEEQSRQRRVFRRDAETGDYLSVPEADWADEKLPLITAGLYR